MFTGFLAMTTPVGPRRVPSPTPESVGVSVRAPATETTSTPAATTNVTATTATAATSTPDPPAALFEPVPGAALAPEAAVQGAGRSQLLARLASSGGSAVQRRNVDSLPGLDDTSGQVHPGSVTIENRGDLAALEGVQVIDGSLTLQEGVVKSADLFVLRDLREIRGRLTIEGMQGG
jgi:hypothetical protein